VSANGRLFACGAGPKSLVEINEGEGTVFKIFEGYSNQSDHLVRMRMSDKSWFVLPDGVTVKFWHVDNVQVRKEREWRERREGRGEREERRSSRATRTRATTSCACECRINPGSSYPMG